MEVGSRVICDDGWVGVVVAIDDPWPDGTVLVDVNWRTPTDEPSVLTSTVDSRRLLVVPDAVKSPAKSEEWMAESRAFHDAICLAIRQAKEREGDE